jgi:hypothetical protein
MAQIFQVTDGNHSTYLFIADNADHAMKLAFKQLSDEGELDHLVDHDAQDAEEGLQDAFEMEYSAEEIPQGQRIDNDGPLSF